MSAQETPDPTCEVCGRRLLPGERATDYVTRDGATPTVCELCKPRAEAAGWMLPEEADAVRAGGGSRERRRPRGQMLGGLLARLPAQANDEAERGAEPEEREDEPSPRRRRAQREPQPSRGRSAPKPAASPVPAGDSPGISLPEALLAFNASDHRRTVAGLTRTLGAPRASGLAVRTNGGYPGARLTVAWEITWYQWEVAPGPRGPEVRESGKGETIDQLRAADRTWNLMIDSDGSLEKKTAAPPDSGEER